MLAEVYEPIFSDVAFQCHLLAAGSQECAGLFLDMLQINNREASTSLESNNSTNRYNALACLSLPDGL